MDCRMLAILEQDAALDITFPLSSASIADVVLDAGCPASAASVRISGSVGASVSKESGCLKAPVDLPVVPPFIRLFVAFP